MAKQLSHVNSSGEATMVDISLKDITIREAVAKGSVIMQPATLELVKNAGMKKGMYWRLPALRALWPRKKSPILSRFAIPFRLTALQSILTFPQLIASALPAP